MLDALWALLKDPANRAALGLVGAVIVAVAGGVWTVVKFFSKKDEGPTSVRAANGSMAAGRDISNSSINHAKD